MMLKKVIKKHNKVTETKQITENILNALKKNKKKY